MFSLFKTRKNLILLLSLLTVSFIIITIFSYFSWSADQQTLKEKGQPDFNTLSQSELKDGLIVKGTIDMALDVYAEEYETTVGIRTSDDSEKLYYLVPVYDEDENGYITFKYLITYEAEPKEFDTMDEIIENTWGDQLGLKTFTVDNARIVGLPPTTSNSLPNGQTTLTFGRKPRSLTGVLKQEFSVRMTRLR
jgi:hypothetical protein